MVLAHFNKYAFAEDTYQNHSAKWRQWLGLKQLPTLDQVVLKEYQILTSLYDMNHKI